jgi:methionyl aminopeptidase
MCYDQLMSIENEKDLEALRKVGRIVAACLKFMHESLEPGMTTAELDAIGKAFLEKHGAIPAPKHFYQFPGTTCISVNHAVAHGLPGEEKLKAGDLVNIDVSAMLDGYVADTGGSAVVPPVKPLYQRLLVAARDAMNNGIREARADAPVRNIGKAMEATARRRGFTVLENLGSHGVGRTLHEEPGYIQGYFDPKDQRRLKKGMVITVEPFVSNGATWAEEKGDGWTLFTPGKYCAQFEHTIVVTDGAPLILTRA